MTPILREPKLRVLGGKLTIRGLVFEHEEHDDGSMFETAPIVVLNTAEMTAATKTVTYKYEGELK